jgi:hypothetical protein
MFAFNEAISNLGLVDVPLKGCKFTWSNKQQDPLLERLHWFFSSNSWFSAFPNTWASALSRDTSDHTPCLISAATKVPNPSVFRFENYWLEHHQFLDVLQHAWNLPVNQTDKAKRTNAKFKNLRRILKAWKVQLPNLSKMIQGCKDTILFLDVIEESRDLSLEEWNFRSIISEHLQSLPHLQKIYWKQRGTIKWVKFGDECPRFFHANASVKHNKNSIVVLRDDSGKELYSHEDKAQFIWNSFKNRLGISEFSGMNIDLSSILTPSENLYWLEEEFFREEIDKIIKELPSNKSPGPDGSNGDFFKRCWPIIANDFYELCADFFEGLVCLRSINSSYITLVPKKDCPISIGDFRPISLLNSSIKLLTKLLAERLQQVIIPLVHVNQYGFIRTRTIQDCLAWAFEYIHLCKSHKKEVVIVKLDFEEDFDKIEHQAIIDILQSKGFGRRWVNWIKEILGSGTSSVLLNGVPGKVFHCRRGVIQGDPLSPLLFVLAADLLQSMVNQAKTHVNLNLPLPSRAGNDFPIVQYADDTLVILEACPGQLLILKDLFASFATATGLKVNYNKTMMFPINISQEQLQNLATVFECQQGSMPFTNLGLPLGTTKPKIEDFLPLVQRVEKRLTSTSAFLSQAGKLEMVNLVLSSSAVYHCCTLKLHKGVIEQIDKYRKHCLWRGSDVNAKQPPKASWSTICLHNDALLMKLLHKFFSRADIPWVHLVWENYYRNGRLPGQPNKGSFWWKDMVEFVPQYKDMVSFA